MDLTSPPQVSADVPFQRGALPVRRPWRLWLYGIGMLVPALSFARRYPLPGNTDTLTDIGSMAHYQPAAFVAFTAGIVVLFGLYVLALYESRRLPVERALYAVFSCGTALATAMAWMYPVNAIDIFLYAVRSRLFTTYGANPIATYPADYPADAWALFAHPEWAVHVSPYGPLWNLIAAPITLVAGDRMAIALVGFKVLAVLCVLAGAWVIVQTLTASPSGNPATGALFYLWNPLVLWEGVGNGHNDVLVTLPLLLALLAWTRRWNVLVLPLLVVAALIKYVPILLIPLAAVALWRRAGSGAARWYLAVRSIFLSVLLLGIALYPFYDLGAIRTSIATQGNIFLASPATVALGLLGQRYPTAEIAAWVKRGGVAIVLATLAWQMFLLWRWPARLPRAGFEVVYAFLLVATWNFRAWYLIWPVGLAALLPLGWPAWRMIAWTAGALAGYGFFIFIEAWWQPGFAVVQTVGVPLMFGATVLLTLAEVVSRGERRMLAARSHQEPSEVERANEILDDRERGH